MLVNSSCPQQHLCAQTIRFCAGLSGLLDRLISTLASTGLRSVLAPGSSASSSSCPLWCWICSGRRSDVSQEAFGSGTDPQRLPETVSAETANPEPPPFAFFWPLCQSYLVS